MQQYEQTGRQRSLPPRRHVLCSRILVVDERSCSEHYWDFLLGNMLVLKLAGKAPMGVEAIGTRAPRKLKPDLIVLDLAMPRMNGGKTHPFRQYNNAGSSRCVAHLSRNCARGRIGNRRSAVQGNPRQNRGNWTKLVGVAFVHCYDPDHCQKDLAA